LCASQTLSRPEFRELSPASFYDYNLSANFRGSDALEQTKIQNYDLRYEYYPGKGEIVSASLFYKHFTNPIELFVPKGLTTTQKIFSYVNAGEAQLMGIELEFRKSLSFLSSKTNSFWSNMSAFGNLAYIHSQVSVDDVNAAGEKESYKRPMQGQSPYVLNGGLMYTQPKSGFAATLVYNRIGQRIFAVGNGEIPELFEAPRNILDASISKKIADRWELKLTVSDILANPMVLYYNIDEQFLIVKEGKGKYSYQADKDYTVVRNRPGTNVSLSVSYQLK
jgi:outer membrane receptor protein involved in Fe transport